MLLKTYERSDFERVECGRCHWLHSKGIKELRDKTKGPFREKCPNCDKLYCDGKSSYLRSFPYEQSGHILGGMLNFIGSYNKKITSPRNVHPPESYIPIIFACSNYETMLSDIVRNLMNRYGSYLGRLARFIIFDEILRKYDRVTNESLFKKLTGSVSVQSSVQEKFPNYFSNLNDLYGVRNNVVHGKKISDSQAILDNVNKAIDILLESVEVFRYLQNKYVSKFEDNVDYRDILKLGAGEEFKP